jgi:hypothetical protein
LVRTSGTITAWRAVRVQLQGEAAELQETEGQEALLDLVGEAERVAREAPAARAVSPAVAETLGKGVVPGEAEAPGRGVGTGRRSPGRSATMRTLGERRA